MVAVVAMLDMQYLDKVWLTMLDLTESVAELQ